MDFNKNSENKIICSLLKLKLKRLINIRIQFYLLFVQLLSCKLLLIYSRDVFVCIEVYFLYGKIVCVLGLLNFKCVTL